MKRRLALILGCFTLFNWIGLLPVQSAPLRQLVYVSPSPGARHISPGTSIAVSAGTPLSPASLTAAQFTVEGSSSGVHRGDVRLSDDGLTALFYPEREFAFGEEVRVSFKDGLRTSQGVPVAGTDFEFMTISKPFSQFPKPASSIELQTSASTPASALAPSPYVTWPEFNDLMPVEISVPANGAGEGLVFLASAGFGSTYLPGLFILDDSVEPVYLQKMAGGNNVTDFKRQTVGGMPYLTYHVGSPRPAWSDGIYYQMDPSYTIIDEWTIGNGYGADEHGMQLLDNGHALMFSYTPIPYDLSPYGGPVDGAVIDTIIQEQDSAKNVVFEWHASQHTPIDNTVADLTKSMADVYHTNAIEYDTDGDLLLSVRHLSEITKIDRTTGDVIWRLGGAMNQFTFTNDDGFSAQHDIRRLPNQNITLFDNGNLKTPTPFSRAVEYEIDEDAKTVTRVWQYPDDQSIYAVAMGNVQRLENGNTFIGWGTLGSITEVNDQGDTALELNLGGLSYRAFRFPWDALPAEPPRLVARGSGDPNGVTLYFSWNGATQIDSYDIYAGATPDSTILVANIPKSGFETSAELSGLEPGTCFFRVQPHHLLGASAPFSNLAYPLDRPDCQAKFPYQAHLPIVGNTIQQ